MCKIEEITKLPNPIGEAIALVFNESNIKEEQVDLETSVRFQYLKNLMSKTIEVAKDESFKRLMLSLADNYKIKFINEVIYMCVSCLALPKIYHKYGFLMLHFKSINIQEILETLNIRERIKKTLVMFSEFSNKVALWEKLEVLY